MTDALRLTVGTLTRFPTRPPDVVGRRTAGRAMLLAPLTAFPPAVVLVIMQVAVAHGRLPAYLAAVLAVAALAWWSRGLHLDGLADTADGLASGYDRERVLDVMHRSDIGPTGVVTLVLVLLLQVAALGSLLQSGAALPVVALLASRQVLALTSSRRIPAARPTGLGAAVAGSVSDPAALTSLAGSLLVGVGLSLIGGFPWYAGALVVLGAIGAALAVVGTAWRRVGGVTGDVLGATVEMALAAGLVVAVLVA